MTSTNSINNLSIAVDTSTAGLSDLGWGINAATGSILSAYVQPIVDTSKLSGVVERADLIQTTTTSIAGQEGNSYLTNQTASVGISGGYAGFTATLSTSFGLTAGGESTNSLATYSQLTQLYQLTIPSAAIQGILTDQFRTDLETMEVAQFYKTYGAYFTSTVVVGGLLSSSIQTSQSKQNSSESLSVAASAAYSEGIANAKVDTEYTYEDSTTQTTYTCSTGLQVIGGKVTSTSAPFDVDAWTNTISESPAVVGYGSQGLTPMWELVTSGSTRQSDLKNGLAGYFSGNNTYILDPLSIRWFRQDTNYTTGPEKVSVSVDVGYKVLGAGAWLYNQDNHNQFLTNCSLECTSGTPTSCIAEGKSVHNKTNATLGMLAIAVYDPDNLLDVKVFSATGDTSSGYPSETVVVAEGYVMTGGGVSTDNASLLLVASQPSSKTSWYGLATAHGDSSKGVVTAYAIGVKWTDPTDKPKLANAISSYGKNTPEGAPTAEVDVSDGSTLVGGGAWVGGSNTYNIMLQSSYPNVPDSGRPQWVVAGHDCQTAASNPITAYAIGLQVKTQSSKLVPFGPGCQSAT